MVEVVGLVEEGDGVDTKPLLPPLSYDLTLLQ
jgi:hypothetical protein